MASSANIIALYQTDDIDYRVISQMLSGHPERLQVEPVTDRAEITSDRYSLCLSTVALQACPIPVLILDGGQRRIGRIMDAIESLLLQNPYGDTEYRNYRLDWNGSVLAFDGKSVPLTERERFLIAEIMTGGENGRQRDFLLDRIWGYRADLETHTLETHIYRLRQKIEDEPDMPRRLVTADGGYKLV